MMTTATFLEGKNGNTWLETNQIASVFLFDSYQHLESNLVRNQNYKFTNLEVYQSRNLSI